MALLFGRLRVAGAVFFGAVVGRSRQGELFQLGARLSESSRGE